MSEAFPKILGYSDFMLWYFTSCQMKLSYKIALPKALELNRGFRVLWRLYCFKVWEE